MPKKNTGVAGKAVTYQIPDPAGGVRLETFIPWTLVKRGVKKQVITPIDAPEHFREEAGREKQVRKAEQDSPLIRALGLAHYWEELLDEGKYRSITEIAAAEGLDKTKVCRICRLVCLAPDIKEAILSGQDGTLTLERLMREGFSGEWKAQRRLILSIPDRSQGAFDD